MRQPARAKPRTARGEDTRQRLIKAAIEVIGERGIAATRVDDVVQAVGCAHGTFYKYFGGKLDLIRQVMTDVYREIHEAALSSSYSLPIEEMIRVGITRMADTVLRLRPILRTLEGTVGIDPELTELRYSLVHRDVETLAQWIVWIERVRCAQVADPYLLALALASMVDEMSRRWLLYEEQISREAFIDSARRGLRGGSARQASRAENDRTAHSAHYYPSPRRFSSPPSKSGKAS